MKTLRDELIDFLNRHDQLLGFEPMNENIRFVDEYLKSMDIRKECKFYNTDCNKFIKEGYKCYKCKFFTSCAWLELQVKKLRTSSISEFKPDVSGSLLIPYITTEKNVILTRAINYIADDVQEDGNKLAKEIAEGLISLLDKQ